MPIKIQIFIILFILQSQIAFEQHSDQSQYQQQRNLQTTYEAQEQACLDLDGILFNIEEENIKYAKKFRTDIRQQWRSENRSQNFIIDPDNVDQGKEINLLIILVLPLLILSVLSLIAFMFYICCQCFPDSICPPCKVCMDQNTGKLCKIQCEQQKPFKGIQLIIPVTGLFVSLTYTIIICIVGLANAEDLENGIKSLNCALVDSLYSMNYGGNQWVGISGFETMLQKFAENIDGTYQIQLENTFNQDKNWISSNEISLDNAINLMQNEFYETSILQNDINFDTTQNTYKYQINPKNNGIKRPSCFFNKEEISSIPNQQCYYPSSTDIMKWEPLVDIINQVNQNTIQTNLISTQSTQIAGENIYLNLEVFATSIQNGYDDIKNLKTTIDELITDLHKDMKDKIQITEDQITPNITNLYLTVLVLSLLLVVCTVVMIFFKFFNLRHFLTINWVFFSILNIILFALSAGLLAVSIFGSEICDFTYNSLNDKEQFLKIQNFDQNLRDKFIVCKKELGGDGDIVKEVGIDKEFYDLQQLDIQIKQYQTNIQNSAKNLKLLQESLDSIQNSLQEIRNTGGINQVLENIDENKILNDINLEISSCTGNLSNDIWIKEISDCNLGTQQELITGHNYINFTGVSPQQYDLTDGQPNITPLSTQNICIWYNGHPVPDQNKLQILTSDPEKSNFLDIIEKKGMQMEDLTNKQYFSRYNGNAGCSTINQKLDDLFKWRQSRNNIIFLKQEQTQNFQNQYDIYSQNQNNYSQRLTFFKQQTSQFTDPITNEKTGLLADNKTNCQVVGQKLDLFYDSLCIVIFPNIYNLSNILILLSSGLFVNSFFLFFTSIRYSKNKFLLDEMKKVAPEKPQEIQHFQVNQVFDIKNTMIPLKQKQQFNKNQFKKTYNNTEQTQQNNEQSIDFQSEFNQNQTYEQILEKNNQSFQQNNDLIHQNNNNISQQQIKNDNFTENSIQE